jgi:pimeloyl-ACP methyl ester carboxylesterase
LYVFAYDWRQDIVDNARSLNDLIAAIRRDYGNPQQQVDIVAHSMGGLIARYFLRHGTKDVLDGTPQKVTMAGAGKVNKLVLLGTPNFGSVSSLHAFISGERVVWNRISPLTLASFPSGYQLFPHPLNTWLLGANGKALPDELFSPETWKKFAWSVYDPTASRQADAALRQAFFNQQLERARRLAWMMSVQEPVSPVHYILFGGGCHPTPARLLLERSANREYVRLHPADIVNPQKGLDYQALMTDPGDDRVTKPSLLARETLDPSAPYHEDSYLPLAYSFFLCDQHANLTSNPHFQDNLLHTLLSPRMSFNTAPSAPPVPKTQKTP